MALPSQLPIDLDAEQRILMHRLAQGSTFISLADKAALSLVENGCAIRALEPHAELLSLTDLGEAVAFLLLRNAMEVAPKTFPERSGNFDDS